MQTSPSPTSEKQHHSVQGRNFPENLPPGWKLCLEGESSKPYFKNLTKFLNSQYESRKPIFPSRENILRALQAVDYPDVKVVLLGQDPYHGDGQAIGLCFGVPNTISPKPPSLVNVFKEVESDLGITIDRVQSDLTGWAAQGVLLLNTVLTVERGKAFSHRNQGWETFTDMIISRLNERKDPIIFILWGSAAQRKKELLTHPIHFILESPHPSPLSAYRGFFGSKPFSKANRILREKMGKAEIEWGRVSG